MSPNHSSKYINIKNHWIIVFCVCSWLYEIQVLYILLCFCLIYTRLVWSNNLWRNLSWVSHIVWEKALVCCRKCFYCPSCYYMEDKDRRNDDYFFIRANTVLYNVLCTTLGFYSFKYNFGLCLLFMAVFTKNYLYQSDWPFLYAIPCISHGRKSNLVQCKLLLIESLRKVSTKLNLEYLLFFL